MIGKQCRHELLISIWNVNYSELNKSSAVLYFTWQVTWSKAVIWYSIKCDTPCNVDTEMGRSARQLLYPQSWRWRLSFQQSSRPTVMIMQLLWQPFPFSGAINSSDKWPLHASNRISWKNDTEMIQKKILGQFHNIDKERGHMDYLQIHMVSPTQTPNPS